MTAMTLVRDGTDSTGAATLVALKRAGIDYLYTNSGTDTAPFVDAWQRNPDRHGSYVTPILCPHENLAVGMAHGYTLATGRTQAVMVHVSVGTANLVCGVMNAARDYIPMLVMAGRTPVSEQGRPGSRTGNINWAQEMFDQAGMVRELVKWDYELKDHQSASEIVDRAVSIAEAGAPGPVYLVLPREVLVAPAVDAVGRGAAHATIYRPAPDAAAIRRVADLVAGARFPIIVTAALGRDASAVAALATLAEKHGIGVVEFKSRMVNFPASHPNHLGYETRGVIEQADVVIVIEADVPWLPGRGDPAPDAHIVHVGLDPLFEAYPVRNFGGEIAIPSSAANFILALGAALAEPGDDPSTTGRRDAIRAAAEAQRARREERRRSAAVAADTITKDFLNLTLNAVRPPDSVVVSEYWVDRDFVDFDWPGSYFLNPPSAGLGWGLPAALGVQQAHDDRLVICALGDGAYMFANPVACHQLAAARTIPLVTILHNNRRWAAVDMSTRSVYAGDQGAHLTPRSVWSDLTPSPDFHKIVEACGGYGEQVDRPADLAAAMQRAFTIARTERRQVLLNVMTA